jgi:hypothetical protein
MNKELKTRRSFIDDMQWERTSSSWKALKPNKNFDMIDEGDETVDEYCRRISDIVNVPYNVADQWLYCLYYEEDMVDNYGWIDYSNVDFVLSEVSTEEALSLHVIKSFSRRVDTCNSCTPFDNFMCIEKDKEFWIENRSWRIPPIVVDVTSFGKSPVYAEFSGDLQLVEGHSRLGYMKSMHRAGERLAKTHSVYLLKNRK